MLRKARHEAGPKSFTASELRKILDALQAKPVTIDGEASPRTFDSDPVMRAMVALMGLMLHPSRIATVSIRYSVTVDGLTHTFDTRKREC
jgi:hypothetical protein